VPVVRLSGVIGAATPLRQGMTLAGVARILERAFGVRGAKAVAIIVNSPGARRGAFVHQSHTASASLASRRSCHVLMFLEDVAASGGYMIACGGGDEIFSAIRRRSSAPSAWSGGSFGFQGLIEKLGVERRLYTSGKNKGDARPVPAREGDDVGAAEGAAARDPRDVHLISSRRAAAAKIKGDEDELFSGAYWTARNRSIWA